jgi:hypothetical protein
LKFLQKFLWKGKRNKFLRAPSSLLSPLDIIIIPYSTAFVNRKWENNLHKICGGLVKKIVQNAQLRANRLKGARP